MTENYPRSLIKYNSRTIKYVRSVYRSGAIQPYQPGSLALAGESPGVLRQSNMETWSNIDTTTNPDSVSGSIKETEVTTTFTEDGEKVTNVFGKIPTYSDYGSTATDAKAFLEKPFLWSVGTWATTDTAATLLTSIPVAVAGFPAIWTDKLKGFKLMRGTVNFRIMINANPFQQGKLLAHWLPPGMSAAKIRMHNINLITMTQHPNIELDCRKTVGEISFPYIAPTLYYNIAGPGHTLPFGTLYLRVLSPLKVGAGGETDLSYSIYVWFTDLELTAPIVPQSARGKFKAKSTSFSEVENTSSISQGLRAVSSVATDMEAIPLLSSVAKPVAWASRVGADIASAFGWSKPNSDSATIPMMKMTNRNMSNADGPDMLPQLAINHDNQLAVRDDFSIYSEDEMSMRFLLSRWSFLYSYNWDTADATNAVIFSAPISPDTLLVQVGLPAIATYVATVRCGGPMWYLSQFFEFYRGGIEMMIKIAKTDFHTGRLQITFTPNPTNSVTVPNTTTTGPYALREIIDIRTGSEVCLTLPYLSTTAYQNLRDGYGYLGSLDIKVINELRAPQTCADNIDLLFYFRAAPDFEYAAPSTIGGTSYMPPFYPQSGRDELICSNIGDSSTPPQKTVYAELCMGESVTSLKQFLNRYSYEPRATLPTLTNGETLDFWPWAPGYYTQNASTGTGLATYNGGDPHSNFAHMYAYYRGGARVMVRTAVSDTGGIGTRNPIVSTLVTAERPTTMVLASGNASFGAGTALVPWFANLQGFTGVNITDANQGLVGVSIPYYCQTHMSIVPTIDTGTNYRPITYDQPKTSVNFQGFQAFSNYYILRSFGDDFQYSYFLNAPPIVIATPAVP